MPMNGDVFPDNYLMPENKMNEEIKSWALGFIKWARKELNL